MIRLAGEIGAARAGIRGYQRDAELGGEALGAGLDREGLFVAGETREIGQYRHALGLRLRRQIDAEPHGEADFARLMTEVALPTAEAAVPRERLQCRCRGGLYETLCHYTGAIDLQGQ